MHWESKEAELIVPVIEDAISKGRIIGGICNASLFLGAHVFLNNVYHTSNTLEVLKQWGKTKYTGDAYYKNQQVVSDKNMVTANGTGYLEFMKEILLLLEAETPEKIQNAYLFYKIGLCELMKQNKFDPEIWEKS